MYLALPITSALTDHSVSKCLVREQLKRPSHCRYFLQFVIMEYVLEAAGCLQLHNVSERMSLSEQELFLHRSVSEISWHVEEEVYDVEVTIPFECPAQIVCNVQGANTRCLGWYQLNTLICLNVMFAMIKLLWSQHYDSTCWEPQASCGWDLMDVWNVLQCSTEWAGWLMSGTVVWWIAWYKSTDGYCVKLLLELL